ncbi:hypothetical protein DSO57_1009722 [Entomophthora muscae]|uniref:Uncharacterized protein n=1 Tax=Entomophthora muscae TaxID=34485 RepID=A0ACC2UG49_9FUNG|nr:hypothetical protein DSO57_1009722 [Entomophthora muscae]
MISLVLGANPCPPGEVPAAISGKCVALCQVMGCDKCSGDSCIECLPGLTLLGSGSCVSDSECPLNKYQLGSECYDCHHLCASCYGPTKNQCLSCKAITNSTESYAEGSSCNSASVEAGNDVCGLGRKNTCFEGCAKCLASEKESSLRNDEFLDDSKNKASSNIIAIAIGLLIVGALGMTVVSRVFKCMRFFGLFKRSRKPREHESRGYSQPYPPFARAHISHRYRGLP